MDIVIHFFIDSIWSAYFHRKIIENENKASEINSQAEKSSSSGAMLFRAVVKPTIIEMSAPALSRVFVHISLINGHLQPEPSSRARCWPPPLPFGPRFPRRE